MDAFGGIATSDTGQQDLVDWVRSLPLSQLMGKASVDLAVDFADGIMLAEIVRSLKELVALEKTETHDLPALADHLISYLPMFKNLKLRNAKDLKAYAKKTYLVNMLYVLQIMELESLKAGKEKGVRAQVRMR